MTSTGEKQQRKQDKRAAALRDNLRRRKDKQKAQTGTTKKNREKE
jgi:hypothetical protein